MARIDDQQVDRVRSDVENTKAHLHTVPGDARRLIGVAEVDLGFPRTWLEFTDPDDPARIFRCDTTWLTSRWQCIFGAGCPGIYADSPNVGCCALGAHFADDDDQQRVLGLVAELDADIWAHHGDAAADGRGLIAAVVETDEDCEVHTRVVDGGCIFCNPPDFPGGPGCALHLLAQRRGWEPQQAKPEVCWQLPIRRDYDERELPDGSTVEVVLITEYDRRFWGPGGHDFDWYCSSNSDAHTASEPVYRSERVTLELLMGTPAYLELVRLLERSDVRSLPHPADAVGGPA